MGQILTPAVSAIRAVNHAAADAAHTALLGALAARAAQPRTLGQFGAVAQRSLPCPSDMDPGADDLADDDTDPVLASDAAMELAGRADRAWQSGQKAAAADLYRSAAQMLLNAAESAAQ